MDEYTDDEDFVDESDEELDEEDEEDEDEDSEDYEEEDEDSEDDEDSDEDSDEDDDEDFDDSPRYEDPYDPTLTLEEAQELADNNRITTIVIDGLFYRKTKKGQRTYGKKLTNNRTFPGLNDFIEVASSRNKNLRNLMKHKYQDIAKTLIRRQNTHPIAGDVYIYYYFYEPDRKRDPSNVASFFIKVFEDALVQCGVIANDNWSIKGFSCYFSIDKKNPRVVVKIEEL